MSNTIAVRKQHTTTLTPSRWERLRNAVRTIHLWVGLGSGLFVIVICLSGTLYVYQAEMKEWAAPELYQVVPTPGASRIAPELLVEKVQQASGGKVIGVTVPHATAASYKYNVRKKGDDSKQGITYMVHPYTGEILGNTIRKNGMDEFLSTLFSLHRWLLLDKVEQPIVGDLPNRKLGSYITGGVTIIFTLGCITGIIIWFPNKLKTWRQGLKIKVNGNGKRLNYDLHNTLAFYSLLFLLVMGITGPQWSYEWYRDGLQKALGTYKPESPKEASGKERGKGVKSKAGAEKEKSEERNKPAVFPISQYLIVANIQLPYEGNFQIQFPKEAGKPIMVTKTKVGFFAPAAGDKLSFDPQTAALKKVEIFRNKPLNERIAGSIKALHIGTVYGGFTKLLYFLACLIATSLPITGTLIWWNKWKKKNIGKSRPLYNANKSKESMMVTE